MGIIKIHFGHYIWKYGPWYWILPYLLCGDRSVAARLCACFFFYLLPLTPFISSPLSLFAFRRVPASTAIFLANTLSGCTLFHTWLYSKTSSTVTDIFLQITKSWNLWCHLMTSVVTFVSKSFRYAQRFLLVSFDILVAVICPLQLGWSVLSLPHFYWGCQFFLCFI